MKEKQDKPKIKLKLSGNNIVIPIDKETGECQQPGPTCAEDHFTEEQLETIGNRLADVLGMDCDPEKPERWATQIGNKTGLGLYRTLRDFIKRIEAGQTDPWLNS